MEEVVLKQAELYLSGMSYREIAAEYKVSHITVRNNLVNRLRNINPVLYDKVMDQVEKNTEKNVRDEIVQKRVLASYEMLVNKNMFIKDIANQFEVNEYVTYRDVTKRLKDLHLIAPDVVTEEMLNKAREVLNRHTDANLIQKERKINILFLYKMYPHKDKRMLFLTKCALTFGLRLESLSMVLKLDKDELYKNMMYNNPLWNSLDMLFKHGMVRQDIAIDNFINYFNELSKASSMNDKTKLMELLNLISDKNAKELIEGRKLVKKQLSGEDIITILKYQLKYMLPSKSVANLFNTSKSNYEKRVKALGEDYASLLSDYYCLEDYYKKLEDIADRSYKKGGSR